VKNDEIYSISCELISFSMLMKLYEPEAGYFNERSREFYLLNEMRV